jgi:hypothetical protein
VSAEAEAEAESETEAEAEAEGEVEVEADADADADVDDVADGELVCCCRVAVLITARPEVALYEATLSVDFFVVRPPSPLRDTAADVACPLGTGLTFSCWEDASFASPEVVAPAAAPVAEVLSGAPHAAVNRTAAVRPDSRTERTNRLLVVDKSFPHATGAGLSNPPVTSGREHGMCGVGAGRVRG